MEDNFCFHDRVEDEEEHESEEALSLSDLPLHDPPTSNETSFYDLSDRRPRRSSSHPQDFFEFFNDGFRSNDDHVMCSADDIIISGKLLPFRGPAYHPTNPSVRNPPATGENRLEREHGIRKPQNKAALGLRSRSESSSKSNLRSTKTKLTWNSRSLDYRKLQRFPPPVSNSTETTNTNSFIKSFGKSADVLAKRAKRPRWCVFVFGMVRFTGEMELEDIKTRQLRRSPTNLFLPSLTETAAATTSTRGNLSMSCRNKGSWKLLKALSCKDPTSVAVTATSLACLPQRESFA